MGEVADAMLDGTLCEMCGEFIGEPVGYPRRCGGCEPQVCSGCDRELDDCMCGPESDGCPGCARGDTPVEIDEDGTLTSVSGRPGRLGHGQDDYYWFCEDYTKEQECK